MARMEGSMTGKYDAFKAFLKQNKDTINRLVNATFPLMDDATSVRVKRGLDLAMEPCFEAFLSARNVERITDTDAGLLLEVFRLLVISIKKRYYAFPDKHVISVDHDGLFNTVLPAAIRHGLVDTNIDLAVALFNAGENLGEPSARFYQVVLRMVHAFPNDAPARNDLIHVLAWLAGDMMRKDKAIHILRSNATVKKALVSLVAGKSANGSLQRGGLEGMSMVDSLIDTIAIDTWLDPLSVEWESFGAGGFQDVSIPASTGVARIGTAGGYEGFDGPFDTPPRIAGMITEGMLVAYTGSGKVFHVAYGATGTQARVIGLHPGARLLYSSGCGLIAIEKASRALNLKTGKVIHSLDKANHYKHVSLAGDTLFFTVAGEKHVGWVGANGTGKEAPGGIEWSKDIDLLAGIDSGRALITCGDTIHEVRLPGKATLIGKHRDIEWMASSNDHALCTCSTGIACLIDLEKRAIKDLGGTIDAEGITSVALNRREIAITRAFTHAIQFYGTPARP